MLIRRSDVGAHGGHLALPGGMRDPMDRSMLETALRETHEDIGLRRDQIEILAELRPTDTRTTNFRIYPVLGRSSQPGAMAEERAGGSGNSRCFVDPDGE